MSLPNRIKCVRDKLSQVSFAENLGFHVATLQRYEKGDRVPDANFLHAVCEKYGVNPTWLLTGEGPMYRVKEGESSVQAPSTAALGLSEEAQALLDLYLDLPTELRKKFIGGMRMMLDLDRHGKDEKVKKLLDLIEKAG